MSEQVIATIGSVLAALIGSGLISMWLSSRTMPKKEQEDLARQLREELREDQKELQRKLDATSVRYWQLVEIATMLCSLMGMILVENPNVNGEARAEYERLSKALRGVIRDKQDQERKEQDDSGTE